MKNVNHEKHLNGSEILSALQHFKQRNDRKKLILEYHGLDGVVVEPPVDIEHTFISGERDTKIVYTTGSGRFPDHATLDVAICKPFLLSQTTGGVPVNGSDISGAVMGHQVTCDRRLIPVIYGIRASNIKIVAYFSWDER